jgi:hypothetical protein
MNTVLTADEGEALSDRAELTCAQRRGRSCSPRT